jgi:hypothetical protein
MPHYFFDIKDGHRLVDPSGSDCKNDAAAFEKAKILAIGVSLDKPAVDPTRRISVLNADRAEIFRGAGIFQAHGAMIELTLALAVVREGSRLSWQISSDRSDRSPSDGRCRRSEFPTIPIEDDLFA